MCTLSRRDYYDDDEYVRPRRQPPKKKKRRRRRKGGKALLFLLLVLLVAGGIFAFLSLTGTIDLSGVSKLFASPTPAPASTQPVSAGQQTNGLTYDEALAAALDDTNLPAITAADQINVEDLEVTPGLNADWTNILLLGGDARDLKTPSRTDTMIICSVNTKTGRIKLSPIMRDTAVKFTNIGENNGTRRINSAYYFGGASLAMQTVNRLLGMNIQKYVYVNFFGFQQIAHAMGGIDMDITQSEMDQINNWVKHQYWLGNKYGIDESNLVEENVLLEEFGSNIHLNGRQTLAYCRIRKIDSDFARVDRQKAVLEKLLKKAKGYSAYELSSLAILSCHHITTNMSLDEMMGLAMIVYNAENLQMDTLRLPLNNTYVQETRNDESMFYDCDWEANAAALHKFIYES